MEELKREGERPVTRRKFLSLFAMVPALAAAYGFFAAIIIKFLYPTKKSKSLRPMFVAFRNQIPTGASHAFTTPKGERVIPTNTGQLQQGENHSFVAFSSRCPHLGCNVHYDNEGRRFVCPCHQGIFDQKGIAVAGPPAQAKQRLSQFQVKNDDNSIYVMVEVTS